MQFFDVSLPLQEGMVVWPGDRPFRRIEKRGNAITSVLDLSTHTGTHIDAPKHFLFSNQSVDKIPFQKLFGPVRVIMSKSSRLLNLEEVKKWGVRPHAKIILKTRNSKLLKQKKFTSDYVSLSLEAARYLAAKKIDLIGIDYYGIEAKSAPGHPVHKALLRAGVVIVEGLDLSKVKPGRYNLVVLPLKFIGADGSPTRAVLWR